MSSSSVRSRLDTLEEIRGISFLAIVLQHALAGLIYSREMSPAFALESAFLLLLIRFAVPMFILVSGMVLFYNYGRGEFDYLPFLRKRGQQILWPYLIWCLFYFLWAGALGANSSTSIFALILGFLEALVKGESFYHLWFMVMIIQFYLVFPIFRGIIGRYRQKAYGLLAVSFVLYIGYLWVYQYQIPELMGQVQSPFLYEILAYRDRLFTSWFFYFLTGALAGYYAEQVMGFIKKALPLCLLVFLGMFSWIFSQILQSGYVTELQGYMVNYQLTLPLLPLMALYIMASMVVLYALISALSTKLPRFKNLLNFAGNYSLGAFFIHPFILQYLLQFSKGIWPPGGNLLQLLVLFTVCSGLSLWMSYGLSKLPFGNFIVGKITR